jgi:hypothetical protein
MPAKLREIKRALGLDDACMSFSVKPRWLPPLHQILGRDLER